MRQATFSVVAKLEELPDRSTVTLRYPRLHMQLTRQ